MSDEPERTPEREAAARARAVRKLNLEWEVTIPWTQERPLYYKGRGSTPAEALADLSRLVHLGVAEAGDTLEAAQRKAAALNDYAESLAIEETST